LVHETNLASLALNLVVSGKLKGRSEHTNQLIRTNEARLDDKTKFDFFSELGANFWGAMGAFYAHGRKARFMRY
jgi:hypothetical protein